MNTQMNDTEYIYMCQYNNTNTVVNECLRMF